MKIAEFTQKNVTLELHVNKVSDVYLDIAGNPVFAKDIDDYWFKRQMSYIHKGTGSKKHTYLIKLTAYSHQQLALRNQKENNWVLRELQKNGGAITGGVITMLRNKGYN